MSDDDFYIHLGLEDDEPEEEEPEPVGHCSACDKIGSWYELGFEWRNLSTRPFQLCGGCAGKRP